MISSHPLGIRITINMVSILDWIASNQPCCRRRLPVTLAPPPPTMRPLPDGNNNDSPLRRPQQRHGRDRIK